jgi:hypothetical protein
MPTLSPRRLAALLLLAAATVGTLTLVESRTSAQSSLPPSDSRTLLGSHTFQTDTVSPPCHPNTHAQRDMATVASRGDIKSLPLPLRQQLVRLAGRPHSVLPVQAFAEADRSSLLFFYYLLDSRGFEPNVFTAVIPGSTMRWIARPPGRIVAFRRSGGPAGGRAQAGSSHRSQRRTRLHRRLHRHPSLFVINNESGWYEGWMIHDLRSRGWRRRAPTATRSSGRSSRRTPSGWRRWLGPQPGRQVFTTDGEAPVSRP